jgi:tRNA threonylcarbamoyladenosine biosynthesis protein TsaB
MSSESLILAIETATLGGSISLTRDGEVLASLQGDDQISHSNTLLKDINTVLRNAGQSLKSVDVFAVATGPGSFTGLRIGIATVKGLAFTLRRPCVGIPTLEAIAHSVGICESVVAALPAGRGEVFVQMFAVSADNITPLDKATHVSPASMLERYSSWDSLCWCGEGARLHQDKIRQFAEQNGKQFSGEGHNGWRLFPPTPNLAEDVTALASRKLANKELQSAEDLRAIYVRPSDAELKMQG